MTRLLLLLLSAALVCGSCADAPVGESVTATDRNFAIKTIDGCEYIEYDKGLGDHRVYSLTHKGDCRSRAHASPIQQKVGNAR